MSFDPNQNAPMGHAPPKKSGALKWILGGLGCFFLIGLLCFGGIGYVGYQAVQDVMNNPAFLEGKASLEGSEALGEAIGNPITVGELLGPPAQTQKGQRVTFVYEVPVTGPNGSGTAKIEVEGQMLTDDWNLESLTAEVDGKEIPLDGGGLDIKIDE